MSRRKRKNTNHNSDFSNRSNSSNTSYKNDGVYYSDVNMYQNDVKEFEKAMKYGTDFDVKVFQRLVLNDLWSKSQLLMNGCIGDFKFEDIKHALVYPINNWRIILGLSETLMRISPYYYRLNMFFSNMTLFNYTVDLYGVKEGYDINVLKKKYYALIEKLEDMNLKDEFSKIMKYLPYQDLFCGLLVEKRNESFIQPLSLKCIQLYKIKDGLFQFRIKLNAIETDKLSAYPDYVVEAYENYINNKGNSSYWYEPPIDKQICIKFNRQWNYPYPLLIGLVKDIFDLDIYKKLQLQAARTDNYKAILSKVPIDEKSIDKPLITPDVLSVFAQMNRMSMTDDIGVLYTVGSEGKAISFKDSANSRNNVADSVSNLYDSSGVTRELFNGSSSGTAVTFSIENDSAFIYSIYRQFERWINRYIKAKRYNNALFKFKFTLIDMTVFNRDVVSKRYREATTLGATVIDKWLATLDITPSSVMGSYLLHEEIFDYHKHFKPLSSTYNSSDSEAGRPTAEELGEMLSDSGEITKDSDANANR